MIDWTDEKVNAAFDQFWSTAGHAECPVHATALDANLLRGASADGVVLDLKCPSCGLGYRQSRAEDHRAGSFHAWTTGEKAALLMDYKAGKTLRCPCDGSLILPSQEDAGGHAIVGMQQVVLRCERCNGEAAAETFHPSEKQS